MKGVLILIEGTDCSGKETQSKILRERLIKDGYKVFSQSFPDYETATGKIVGGPYLGKPSICDSYFEIGAVNVDPKVAGHYYAADRLDKKAIIDEHLKNGEIVVLDRYVTSNMAHQGSKYENMSDRLDFYNWCVSMEYVNNKLPKPDCTIFLHMPYKAACELKKSRTELDGHENNPDHLKKAEETYIELAELFKWDTVECLNKKEYKDVSNIRTIEEISDEVYERVINKVNELNKKGVIK